jgi:hypothetical protein
MTEITLRILRVGGRSNFVLDKGDGKAYFKAKHSRRLRNQLHTGAEAQ